MKIHLAIIIVLFLAAASLWTAACRKQEGNSTDTTPTTPLSIPVPPGFPPVHDTYNNNPITLEGFELGRKLFYEGRLSRDGNFPCGSCHQQFAGFATFDHSLSHGFNNQLTTRNAPGLFNLAWYREFHWDGGINHLEVQPLAPITAPNEMAETVENVLRKLQADPEYPTQFQKAFGTSLISSQHLLKALSQFMGMMVSANSRYDKMINGEVTFTSQEQRGYTFFQQNCAACHKEPLFTDQSYRNTGMAMNSTLKDVGRMRITGNPADSLKFKVPSLRNLMLTFPYGHDGRFFSVGAVIDHYRFFLINGPTTDPLLKNRLTISDDQKNDLIVFLRTLTDSSFINDKRFSEN